MIQMALTGAQLSFCVSDFVGLCLYICVQWMCSRKKERCTLPHHVVPFANKPREMGHAQRQQHTHKINANKQSLVWGEQQQQHCTTAAFYLFKCASRSSVACVPGKKKTHTFEREMGTNKLLDSFSSSTSNALYALLYEIT